ncbi:MAG: hypothetical protein ACK5L3_11705 [Oscillospiraceae bacterium]
MNNELDIKMDIKMNHKCFPDIEKLHKGQAAEEGQILKIVNYIDKRYDCADFRLVCILRSLYHYAGFITQATQQEMKRCVLGFKYWMDEPGGDSMCYWSENHQLLFAACEYLAGQMYPQEQFTNNGMTGAQRKERGKERLHIWFETRFKLGFVEWHSNTYYEEDIAPLSLLIDCSRDAEIVQKATILLDLLLLDMAMHSYRGFFCATSGRCYEAQKKNVMRQDVLDIEKKAFGFHPERAYDFTRLSADFILNKNYSVPKVLCKIAQSTETAIIKDSMGLALKEVNRYFADKPDMLHRGMYLWSMEAFSNTVSANQTLDIFHAWNLKENDFLKNLQAMYIPVVRHLRLTPLLIRLLNPVTQGIAIQRANTYTYRTPHYMLSSAQGYHPGQFGDQQHLWQATVGKGATVFSTHPGAAFFDDNARNFSPSYWVGNGINPHTCQHENVCLCLYNLNVRKGMLEKKRQWLSHAWLNPADFDEMEIQRSTLITARSGHGYIALFSLLPMEQKEEGDWVQCGKITAWAAVLGSEETHGGYGEFVEQVRQSRLVQKGKTLSFSVNGRQYKLHYKQNFVVNGQVQKKEYSRLESPFGTVSREPKEYAISCQNSTLRLAWEGFVREVGN